MKVFATLTCRIRHGATWSARRGASSSTSERMIPSIPMLHVRGSGDDVLAAIAEIVALVGGRALDCSTGDFLTGDLAETAGWQGFQRYRDEVLRDN